METSRKKANIDPQVGKEKAAGPKPKLEDDSGEKVPPFPVDNVREIWLKVFGKLVQQDKVTFLATSPECHDWVASQRTLFLFHEIATILLETLPEPLSLQCRQLCRQWTQELDKQYSSHLDHLRFTFENERVVDGPQLPQYVTRFHTLEQVQKFLDENGTHPGNPFPGRTILVKLKLAPGDIWKLGTLELCREYWKKVGQILLQFGSHVHFFIIHCWARSYETHLLDGFEILRNYLLNLPNLKRLKIVKSSIASKEEVREFLETKPLPQLADLEMLELWDMHHVLMNTILNCCTVPSKIKRLCFEMNSGEYRDNHKDLYEMLEKFTNLEALELANLCGRDFVRFGQLRSLTRLTHLNLGFWRDDLEAVPFFATLEAFGKTLTHLKITTAMTMSLPAETRINLPHLVRLDMAKYEGKLDPLVQLTSLTFLSIDKVVLRKKDKKSKSKIQVYGFEKRMYKSNIWNVMPTLQIVVIGKKVFERYTCENGGKK